MKNGIKYINPSKDGFKYINSPKVCDICQGPFVEDIMFDAATVHGTWVNMCMHCFNRIGRGLGTGLGQQYKKNEAGEWIRIAG